MIPGKLSRLLAFNIFIFAFFGCNPEEVIVNGDIEGLVTDAATSQPVQAVKIKLIPSNDTTSTGNDGTYHLKNITPGDYEIQASKNGYAMGNENVKVVSAMTKQINFRINKVPTLVVSTTLLDFGLDSTRLIFNLSKIGTGTLTYNLSKSQNWIGVSPSGGEITDEADTITITVNINKTGLSKGIYKETITIAQYISPDESQEVTMDVYLNGFWIDSKYINIVRIGSQVWMAENLNVGTRIDGVKNQTDNRIIEKYCYGDGEWNCDIYGGLYLWDEMMQYNPPEDTGTIAGATQGICPNGWHIPTHKEWRTMQEYLGGESVAGGKLKEAGFAHWAPPNAGATNESGFTALPGGYRVDMGDGTIGFWELGIFCEFWSSNSITGSFDYHEKWRLAVEDETFAWGGRFGVVGLSVRCVRNP